MEELHAAIAAFLRRQRPATPQGRRTDPPADRVREAAIYARVAPTLRDPSPALDGQIAACRAFAAERGETVGLTYREVATGDTLERPRLTDLRVFVALGRIGTVLVTTPDRLARDPAHLEALRAEWAALGVAIVAVMG